MGGLAVLQGVRSHLAQVLLVTLVPYLVPLSLVGRVPVHTLALVQIFPL